MNDLGLPFDEHDEDVAGLGVEEEVIPAEKPAGAKKKSAKKGAKPGFEESLERLEKIVEEMESGDLSLEDSLKRFEEGSKLANLCTKKLDDTTKKIELLTKDSAGNAQWQPYEADSGDNPSDPDSIKF